MFSSTFLVLIIPRIFLNLFVNSLLRSVDYNCILMLWNILLIYLWLCVFNYFNIGDCALIISSVEEKLQRIWTLTYEQNLEYNCFS